MGDRWHTTRASAARVSERRTWRLAVIVAVLVAVAGISTSVQARAVADPSVSAAQTGPAPQLTGLAASVLTRPSAVRGSDGRLHIAYELVLTGSTPFAVDVEQFEVRDARTHRVLLSLAGDALSSRMNPVGGAPAGVAPPDTTLIGPSGSAVIWLDVLVRRKAGLPRVLEHRIVSSTRPPPGERSVRFTSLVGRVPLRSRPPLKLGPPVRSGIWGAGEGCCDNGTHHRRGLLVVDGNQVVPQRFAIDWMRLDGQHRAWVGDPARLSSYLSYGQPLIAAAAGRVVEAVDRFPDQVPPDNPTPPTFVDLPGNHVTLRVGPGSYLIYAHMKPGSVRVRVGERVRRGQVLGQLGNSGNSATPHLHLQAQTTRSFASDGLPFVFRRFRFLGQITSPDLSDEVLGLRSNGQLPFAPASGSGTRRDQMPLDRSVVRFP
jgi:Peptidase family M23